MSISVSSPVGQSDASFLGRVPRFIENMRRLFRPLCTKLTASEREKKAQVITEFLTSERDLCGKRSVLTAIIRECEDVAESVPENVCTAIEVLASIKLSDPVNLRQRIALCAWDCARRAGHEEADAMRVLILRCIADIPVAQPPVLERIAADCVSIISSGTQDPHRRTFACQMLVGLIESDSSTVRSLQTVRELTGPLLWDICGRCLAQQQGTLAAAVAQLSAGLIARVLDSGVAATEEIEGRVAVSGSSSSGHLCALLHAAYLASYGAALSEGCLSACEAALQAVCADPAAASSGLHCRAAGMLLGSATTDRQTALFDMLVAALRDSDSVLVRCEAAAAIATSVAAWNATSGTTRVVTVLEVLQGICGTAAGVAGLEDAVVDLAAAIVHNAPAGNAFLVASVAAKVGSEENLSRMPAAVTAHLLALLRRLLEVASADVPLSSTVLALDSALAVGHPNAEIVSESLRITALRAQQAYLGPALRLLHNASPLVRASAASTVATLSSQIKPPAGAGAMVLDKTVLAVVESLLDVAVADMDADLRFRVLSTLGQPFDLYLSLPDNIATIFMAYNDVDDRCSESALRLLCRLLQCHPAHVSKDLQRIQEELLKELEERNPVALSLASARKLEIMVTHGTLLVPCRQIERVVVDKLSKKIGLLNCQLLTHLIQLLRACLRHPAVPHEDFSALVRLCSTLVADGQTTPLRVLGLQLLADTLRSRGGIVEGAHMQVPEVFNGLADAITNTAVHERVKRAACEVLGVFGAVNPVRMRALRSSGKAIDVAVSVPGGPSPPTAAAPLSTSGGGGEATTGPAVAGPLQAIRPPARTHPKLPARLPGSALYLMLQCIISDESEGERQAEALKGILSMLADTPQQQKVELLPFLLPVLRQRLLEADGSALHRLILDILVNVVPLFRVLNINSSAGSSSSEMQRLTAEASELMLTLETYCLSADAAAAPLSCVVVNVLDELARALPATRMQNHRWAVDFIMSRLTNDVGEHELILRVIRSLESFASFMKEKDLRYVVPHVLQCLASTLPVAPVCATEDTDGSAPLPGGDAASPDAPSAVASQSGNGPPTAQLIAVSCLEFIHLIITKYHVLARDLCASIVHRILDFVASRTEPYVCELAMGTLVSLLASVDKAGRRFMELIVRHCGESPVASRTEGFRTISQAFEAKAGLQDHKVKLPVQQPAPDPNALADMQLTFTSELADLTERAFRNELWNMRISPQYVHVLNVARTGKTSVVEFKFTTTQGSEERMQEFMRKATDPKSALRRNLRILDINQKKPVPLQIDLEFLRLICDPPQRQRHKREAKWLEWFHRVCAEMLRVSPHHALRALHPIATGSRDIAFSSFPFAVTALTANLEYQPHQEFMRALGRILVSAPMDVKQMVFGLAEFMESDRFAKRSSSAQKVRQISCIVVRQTPDAKFGINYDQDSKGIVVTRLAPGGPGELACVPVGASLVSINGERVRNVAEIPNMIKGKIEIRLVLLKPVDQDAIDDTLFINLQTLVSVSDTCQMHARSVYFNEVTFERLFAPLLQDMGPATDTLAASGPRQPVAAAVPKVDDKALLRAVENLISSFQQLGLMNEAKGVLSFVGARFPAMLVPDNLGFDQAATLEQLHWWSHARRLYESRMDSEPQSLVGAVRCWDALGDMHRIVTAVQERADGLPKDVLGQLEPYMAKAAFLLGDWAALVGMHDASAAGLPEVIPRVAALVHKGDFPRATDAITAARDELFEDLVDTFSEGYVRAYDLLVQQQHLCHLAEVVEYATAVEDRRLLLRQTWSARLRQMAAKPQHWRTAVAINSLVLSQEEDLSMRLECAMLCTKSQGRGYSEHVLLRLLHTNDIADPRNWRESNPQVVSAYAQHMFAACTCDDERLQVYQRLTEVLQGSSALGGQAEAWGQCWMLLGEWSATIRQPNQRTTTLQHLQKATAMDPRNSYAFHCLGRAHQALAPPTQNGATRQDVLHVAGAISALFKAVQLSSSLKTTLQDILRILSMWFEFGREVEVAEEMRAGILATDRSVWLGVIPQLVARMGIGSRNIRDLLTDLLTRIGESFPQALIYPLTVSELSGSKKGVAERALLGIRQLNEDLVRSASLISSELVRMAILWTEHWQEAIRKAAKSSTDCVAVTQTLQSLYVALEQPATPNEVQFATNYRATLTAAWGALMRKEDVTAWSYLKKVYSHLTKAVQERKMLMRDVSPLLAELRNSVVAVPGTFRPNRPVTTIASFQSSILVMASKQKPRRFGVLGSDGRSYRFLLKGHEDLRQDERVMQFIELVNSLLANDASGIEYGYAIPRYAVVPLTDNVGIIGWVENTETIFRLLEQRRQDHDISIYQEVTMIVQKGGLASIEDYHKLPKDRRIQLLRHVMASTPRNELALVIWERNDSAEAWLDYRKQYAQTFALMSMVGYVLGLGDRHLNNLMLQNNGNLVHIDFGDCFEVAMKRQYFAEAVPFRLTRLLVCALGVAGVDGSYRITCESVMGLLRRNRENLRTILEAFLYDPLINWHDAEDSAAGGAAGAGGARPAGDQPQSEQVELACSLSTRRQMIGDAMLTDEWALLAQHLRTGGDRVRRATEPLPPGADDTALKDAIDQVRRSVREGNYALANAWMQHIQRAAPDACVQSVFQQSVAEKRSLAAKNALARVEAKLSGTDFSEVSPPASTVTAQSMSFTDPTNMGASFVLRPSAFDGDSPDVVGTPSGLGTTSPGGARPLKVLAQVKRLIDEATSLENLSDAYLTGWAPFW